MDNLPHMCHFDVCCIFINWFPRSAADREQCAPIGNPVQRSHTHERKREGGGCLLAETCCQDKNKIYCFV